jgi:galactokinase
VVTENARTQEAAHVMQQGNAIALGKLMNASHDSLRDDFEVSSNELNIMVDCARSVEGCYGARMTGAGFGGCAVALVRGDVAESFAATVSKAYQTRTNLDPHLYICHAANGAEAVA